MSPLLEVRNVSHQFRGLRVLRNVDLAVAKGSITGLIGPNGAGKTTLFNIISGFLRPNEGEVVYAGEVITRRSVQRRSYAGLVRTFQTPQLFRDLTVRENLLAGCFQRGRSGVVSGLLGLPRVRRELREAAKAADEVCETFGLNSIRERNAGELPAGRQRIVELARAAMLRPRLLCLDEPSSGLSSEEAAELVRAMRRLNGDGVTILLVSHDMELMAVSSLVSVLCFGQIIATGAMSEVQSDARVREAYLGT